jgi:predicted ArsR family transcriptional regulator
MATNGWLQRLLKGSRGRIVAELRRGPATVNELIERLDLSANAVRSHLAALERDCVIAADEPARGGVGKPANVYRLTSNASALTPKAYDAMLATVLEATRGRVGARGYETILNDVAAKLAGDEPLAGTFEERLRGARKLLALVGANVEVRRSGNTVRLHGSDCPLASLVAVHPELCGVVANVIARRLGTPVRDCCNRSDELPRCCFETIVDRAA